MTLRMLVSIGMVRTSHQVTESVEEKGRVVRARARLGVKLHGKGLQVGVVDTLARAVVGVDVADDAGLDALGHDGVAMVLAGEKRARARTRRAPADSRRGGRI